MRFRRSVALSVTVVVLAGCSSKSTFDTRAPAGPYRPVIDPSTFSDRITNRYLPLTPGKVFYYEGTSEGRKESDTVTVTRAQKTIMGVRCVVVYDVVSRKGEIVEATYDWFAQDAVGNVWYFGEDSKAYRSGTVTSTSDSWEAGVDGALPGIVMPANPRPGPRYREEYYKGHAEDVGRVLRTDATIRVPTGRYRNVLLTAEFSPLEPSVVELKYYAPGVGFVYSRSANGEHEEFRLVRIGTG